MIQRWQSLYLLLMAVISFIMLLTDLPLTSGRMVQSREIVEVGIVHSVAPAARSTNYWVVILLTMSCLFSILALFGYKRLRVQLKLVAFNFLLIGLSVVFMLYAHFEVMEIAGGGVRFETYYFTWTLPVLLAVLNILSFRAIKKDIELLASVDRLR